MNGPFYGYAGQARERALSIATDRPSKDNVVRLSAEVVAAFLRKNTVAPDAVPKLISSVHAAFAKLDAPAPVASKPAAPKPQRPRPAVAIARSVQRNHIVCLEDGKKLRSLTRYLRARFGMSPDEYRRKWGLAPDYPMTAPSYVERRWLVALEHGSGAERADELPPQRARPFGQRLRARLSERYQTNGKWAPDRAPSPNRSGSAAESLKAKLFRGAASGAVNFDPKP
jgi:predicted transcriptional regulator